MKRTIGIIAILTILALSGCTAPVSVESKAETSAVETTAAQETTTEQETTAPETTAAETAAPETEAELPGPDVVEVVNLRGDEATLYKLADGTYMDRETIRYTYNGTDTWYDEDCIEWNEVVR